MAELSGGATRPGEGDEARRDRGALLRPRYVFPALLLLVVVTVLLTPVDVGRRGDPRLTTTSAESQGARAFYELAGRLGWRTSRRQIPFTTRTVAGATREPPRRAPLHAEAPLDSTAVYAVLDPPTDLSAAEAGALLAAVRRGAGLLVVLHRGGTLADSLALRPSLGGAVQAEATGDDSPDSCPPNSSRKGGIDWPGGRVFSYWLEPRSPLPAGTVSFAAVEGAIPRRARGGRPRGDGKAPAVRDRAPRDSAPLDSASRDSLDEATDEDTDDGAEAVWLDGDSVNVPSTGTGQRDANGLRAAIVGYPLGAGRVVAVADPDWLRNDVLRVCRWNAGVQAARMLEYLAERPGATRSLVFDEYHQGFGSHPSTLRALRRALLGHPLGRTTTQAIVAALILLAALGARAIAPRSAARLSRRSPLEHVGALSRAYAQIGATRLATRRLVRGLRRRHGGWGTALGGPPRAAGRAGQSDDAFLEAIAERFPSLAADAALLRQASATPRTPEQLLEVGLAAERIERALAAGGNGGPPGGRIRRSPEPSPAR